MTNRTDNFNRADGAIGTPSDGGSAWNLLSGTWTVATNKAANTSGGAQEICVLEASVANVDVQAVVSGTATNGGLIARAADNSNYFVLVIVSNLRIFKNVAGSFTLLGTGTGTVVAGDTIKLTVDSSNVVTGFINGVSDVTATDSAGSGNTSHGIRASADTTVRYDDFSITQNGVVAVTYPQLERGIRGVTRGVVMGSY